MDTSISYSASVFINIHRVIHPCLLEEMLYWVTISFSNISILHDQDYWTAWYSLFISFGITEYARNLISSFLFNRSQSVQCVGYIIILFNSSLASHLSTCVELCTAAVLICYLPPSVHCEHQFSSILWSSSVCGKIICVVPPSE